MGKLDQDTGTRGWRPNCSTSRTRRVQAKLKAQQKIHQSAMPPWSSKAPCATTLNATQVNSKAAIRTQSSWEMAHTSCGMMESHKSVQRWEWLLSCSKGYNTEHVILSQWFVTLCRCFSHSLQKNSNRTIMRTNWSNCWTNGYVTIIRTCKKKIQLLRHL